MAKTQDLIRAKTDEPKSAYETFQTLLQNLNAEKEKLREEKAALLQKVEDIDKLLGMYEPQKKTKSSTSGLTANEAILKVLQGSKEGMKPKAIMDGMATLGKEVSQIGANLAKLVKDKKLVKSDDGFYKAA